MAQKVKNLPAIQEIWVQSLGWEDPLKKGMATHYSVLAWRISRTLWSMGLLRVLSDFHFHFLTTGPPEETAGAFPSPSLQDLAYTASLAHSAPLTGLVAVLPQNTVGAPVP